jgi:transcriptional regulator with XRE-family HTH domain
LLRYGTDIAILVLTRQLAVDEKAVVVFEIDDIGFTLTAHLRKTLMNVAHQIRQLRYSKGWSPDDLAGRAHISRTALYQIENGKTGLPRAATLRRIAEALGVAPENLIVADEAELSAPVAPRAQRVDLSETKSSRQDPHADEAQGQGWLRELELERKYRVLLRSPLRDAMIRIVEATFQLLPPETREATY